MLVAVVFATVVLVAVVLVAFVVVVLVAVVLVTGVLVGVVVLVLMTVVLVAFVAVVLVVVLLSCRSLLPFSESRSITQGQSFEHKSFCALNWTSSIIASSGALTPSLFRSLHEVDKSLSIVWRFVAIFDASPIDTTKMITITHK